MAVLSFGDQSREEMWTAYQYGHPNKGIVEKLNTTCTAPRTSKQVMVGNSSKNFEEIVLTNAVYGVGWEDNTNFVATWDGVWHNEEEAIVTRIDINTADLAMLQSVKHIGPTKGKAIIDYRKAHGKFATLDDLDNVPGIGPGTIALIRNSISL